VCGRCALVRTGGAYPCRQLERRHDVERPAAQRSNASDAGASVEFDPGIDLVEHKVDARLRQPDRPAWAFK
jgi:hypothetical protein